MEAIKVNLIPNGIPEACHASQYDEGRQIRLDIFDGLTPYTIQAGDTFTLNVRKPDNHVITETVTGTEGNTYLVIDTTEQMTAVTGENLCEIRLENGGDNIGSLNFIMQVEKDVIANGIPSESVIEDLEALVVEAVGDNYYTKSETDELLEQKADVTDLLDLLPTDNASGAVANFTDGADNVPVKALSVEFSASQASGTPTPSAPIPITPVNSIAVTRTGKNLLGGSKLLANAQAYLTGGTTDTQNKTFTFNANATATSGLSFTSGVKFKENTAYTFILACSKSNTNVGTNIRFSYTDGTYANLSLDGTITADTKYTKAFTSNSAKTLDKIIKTNQSGSITIYYDECGVFEGDISETDYEAYNGVTKTLDLGGDYYGGSVNKDGNITLDKVCLTMVGDENWIIVNEGQSGQRFRTVAQFSGYSEYSSSHFEAINSNTGNWGRYRLAGGYLILTDNNNQMGSVDNLKTWLATQNANGTPVKFEFEVATPATAQASNAIDFNTLLGDNNFFSDAGDVDVTIRADIALYIQKMLGGNVNRSLGANPSILRTGAISTDIEVREPLEPDSEPVELEREVTEQPENEGNDNEER